MAITVTSDQTLLTSANTTTGWTTAGTWGANPAVSDDVYLEGTNAINARASAPTPGTVAMAWSHWATASNLDLTTTSQHVYFWIKCFSLPSMEKRVRGGIGVSISSTAGNTTTGTAPWSGISDSKQWFVTGNDFDPTSGWVCYVVDPASTANLSVGTPVMSSVDRIGIRTAALQTVGGGSVKPNPVIWDRLSYGTKLTMTGSTGTFQDINTADATTANQYGILTKTSGIFFAAGKLVFGTTGQSAPMIFTDTNQTIVWQDFRVSSTFYEIQLVGNTTPNVTTVTLGAYSGGLTANGCVIRGTGLASQYAVVPVIVAGGSGYTANDILTVTGGTFTTAAQIKVITVSSGAVATAQMETEGSYSVPPTGTLSVTGGTGSGATFTLTFVGGSTWTLTASAANQTLNLYGSSISELKSAALATTTTIRGCTFSNFGTITTGGALIDNSTFQDLRTATPISATYALIVGSTTEMANITNCKFVNAGRALKLTAAGDYTFTGNTFSGNTYDIENSSNATATDTNTTQDGTTPLNDVTTGVGQSVTGDGGKLANVVFYLSKSNTPTGTAVAKLYAHSGVFGTSSIPTGAALATSKSLDVSTLTGSLVETTFFFADQNQNVVLTAATNYVITLEYSGGTSTNTVNVARNSSTVHSGNLSTYAPTTWTPDSAKDAYFRLRTGGVITVTLVDGSDPTYAKTINTGTQPGVVTINTGVNLTINVQNTSQANISGASVTIFETSTPSNVLLNTTTNGSGNATASITLTEGTGLTVRVRKSSSGSTRYIPVETTTTVPGADATLTVVLSVDSIVAT